MYIKSRVETKDNRIFLLFLSNVLFFTQTLIIDLELDIVEPMIGTVVSLRILTCLLK